MKKIMPIVIVALILVGGGAFWGGMKYGQSKTAATRQQRFQEMTGQLPGGNRAGASGAFTSGEIISKDGQNLTVKLRDGGSKIVFYSDSTEVSKFASGSAADLVVGQSVTVSGKANSDGSLTAQTIQVRPSLPGPTPKP